MPCPAAAHDVHPSGFIDRAPLSAAWAWLDRQPNTSTAEAVPLAEAAERVLAQPVVPTANAPDRPRSAENGYAVRASDCDGASAYNPLLLSLLAPGAEALAPATASPIASGLALPTGADAVLPFDAAQPAAGARMLEVLAPVAPGSGIERSRSAGSIALEPGLTLRPRHVGYLAAMGVEHVTVWRRPRIAVVVPGPKSGSDALTPMLGALLRRDGAHMEWVSPDDAGECALAAALRDARVGTSDLVLIAGRAGIGLDDKAAIALRAAGGTLALHELALRPGLASGLGTLPSSGAVGGDRAGTGKVPVILLPGEPLACLVAYDMLAARLVRRLARARTASPFLVAEWELARKIVSDLGIVDIVLVRLAGSRAVPVSADGGLAGAAGADGFVVVGEGSEGYPQGARVSVHLYDTLAASAREANA